jgi:hypothetical protein
MEFVNPIFLFGLAAISIPIIIHLFNFRRYKKVYFTNVEFIKEIKQETKKKSKIKHLLILLFRILAIVCLVFAFSRPFIPVNQSLINQGAANAVSIFIDNSYSLEAVSESGNLLDEGKSKAKEITSIYKPSDVFQLLTNDFEPIHQHFVSRDEFLEILEKVSLSPAVKNISEANKRQIELFESKPEHDKSAYIISDFQKSISDIDLLENDTSINTLLIPVFTEMTNNLFIDSCWFESPVQQINSQVKLFVRIKNSSDVSYEKIPVKLIINNKQKALASFDIEPESVSEIPLIFTNYETGIQNAVLEITDYPITYDDKFYFSYSVSSQIRILCINSSNENIYLNSIYGNDSTFVFQNILEKSIDYSSLNNFNLIILNELDDISSGLSMEIKRFVENGGSLIIIPSADPDLTNYKNFLTSLNTKTFIRKDTNSINVSDINLDHAVYSDVFENDDDSKEKLPANIDLPVVHTHFETKRSSQTNEETLLLLQNGDNFLSVQSNGKGKVYVLSSPLSSGFSNFPVHPVFVPTMYNIALLSKPSGKLYYTIGKNEVIEINPKNSQNEKLVYKIKENDSDFEIIPEYKTQNFQVRLLTHDQIKNAANYTLKKGNENIMGISYNFNRKESELDYYSENEIQEILDELDFDRISLIIDDNKALSQTLEEMANGIQLWKLFIILALVFLLCEVLIIRVWK